MTYSFRFESGTHLLADPANKTMKHIVSSLLDPEDWGLNHSDCKDFGYNLKKPKKLMNIIEFIVEDIIDNTN